MKWPQIRVVPLQKPSLAPVCGHTSTPSVTRVTSQYSLIGLCGRQETLFNGIASLLYLGASALLSFTVQSVLWPQYVVTPYFQVYPALTAAYVSNCTIHM